MDELHLLRAIRYVLLNPVRAGLVAKPEDWLFSSARSHLLSLPDDLISPAALSKIIDDWPSLLDPPTSSNSLELFRKHSSTGRPLGSSQFQARIESLV
jgi:putative transposase